MNFCSLKESNNNYFPWGENGLKESNNNYFPWGGKRIVHTKMTNGSKKDKEKMSLRKYNEKIVERFLILVVKKNLGHNLKLVKRLDRKFCWIFFKETIKE